MEGLFSLLLFAILFFVMMRFGCGAHMRHGHNKKPDHSNRDADQKKHIDPVCSMEVDADKGYGKMYQATLYRFCSRDCLDKFEAYPERFVTNKISDDDHRHEGGAL